MTAILDEDAAGVHMLRLYQGLVLREGSAWRFVCSQIYGGAGQDLAASLPGGGAAVAIPTGLVVMRRDGTVVAHPDPEAQRGVVTAFARTAGKLYALRTHPDRVGSDLIEITDRTVRVLWTDTRYWNDVAVGESSLALVRFEQDYIEALRVSYAGEVQSQQMAMLHDPLEVTVRVLGDVPYYTVKMSGSTSLGRFDQNAWRVVLNAGNALAGPLALPDGTVLVALDGVLSTFANDKATPLPEPDFVIGLSQLENHPYACTRTGLRDVSSSALGTQLFGLSELLAPDTCLAPEALRNACELEWQHFQVELLGANIPVATDDAPARDCVAPATGFAGASMPVDRAGSLALGQAGAPQPTTNQASSSCNCCIVRRTDHLAGGVCAMLFAFVLFVRTRRRARA
ncbi:MAG TPA: hypothetical protein VJR89_33595 [Polyangiales bacterium]|nr:hypothetical protein [Polyangiales bacterium]